MKNKFLYVLVALAFAFTTCNKDSSPVGEDEDVFDASIKGYTQLEPGDKGNVKGTVFKWNSITASEFAKGKTPPFNNWSKPLADGVVVYRVKDDNSAATIKSGIMNLKDGQSGTAYLEGLQKQVFGNGNDPVYIWFDYAEILPMVLKGEVKLRSSITVLVRYRAGNNVAIEFNIIASALYCGIFGPISLDCASLGKPDLGEVTQVRIEDKTDKCTMDPPEGDNDIIVNPDPKEIEVCFVDQDDTPVFEGCVTIPVPDGDNCIPLTETAFDKQINKIKEGLTENQGIASWLYSTDGEHFNPFEFVLTKVCDDITLKPVISTTYCVKVNGFEKGCKEVITEPGENCTTLSEVDFVNYIADYLTAEDLTLDDIAYWVVVGGTEFKFGITQICNDIILEPVLKKRITVCVFEDANATVLLECKKQYGVGDNCPVFYAWKFDQDKDYLEAQVESKISGRKKLVGWIAVDEEGNNVEFIKGKSVVSCTNIKVTPVIEDFSGYEVAGYSGECHANVFSASITVIEKWGSSDGKQLELPIEWGGTDTNPNLNWIEIIPLEDHFGCGTYDNAKVKIIFKNGDYEDTIFLLCSVHGNKLVGVTMVPNN